MKVSVVVRAYNRAYVIREALASVLRQTYPTFEIIVVDDGSTDNTSEVVHQIGDDKIRYIRHDENRGVSVAGNMGIQAATGEVLANLDTDDLWRPEMLASLVEVLNRHPEAGAAFCDVEVIREKTSVASLASSARVFPKLLSAYGASNGDELVFTKREMYLCLLEEIPIKPTSVLIRRSVLDRIGGYNEQWQSGEDWELYLRIAKHFRFGYLNRPLATLRILGDSTLTKFFEADKLSLRRLILAEKRALQGDSEAMQAANRAIAQFENDLGWTYLHSGRRIKSVATYCRGFAETGDVSLLMKAALASLPLSLREVLKNKLSSGARGT